MLASARRRYHCSLSLPNVFSQVSQAGCHLALPWQMQMQTQLHTNSLFPARRSKLPFSGDQYRSLIQSHSKSRILQITYAASEDSSQAGREAETRTFGMRLGMTAKAAAAGAAATALGLFIRSGPVAAADFVKVGECLVGNCQVELAKCIADSTCAENLLCLQNCNGREDESECQIRCGDLYASPAVEQFTKCAVSEKGCVPQRKDNDEFPIPPDRDLVKDFNLRQFQGQWNITAGLNFLFDTFDCQLHNFEVERPGRLRAEINWRVSESDGDFIPRHAVQTFDQKPEKPGYLRNDHNDFLNYTDDWYIIGWKPDAYAVIYYRGNNDAWQGYGGLTVYTRSLEFPEEYRDEINAALHKLKLDVKDLRLVDNSCPPHPDKTPAEVVEGAIEDINPKEVTTQPPPIDTRD